MAVDENAFKTPLSMIHISSVFYISKLNSFVDHPILIAWIDNYLSGTSIEVVVDSIFFDEYRITGDVLPGSCLLPCLFHLFFNDFWISL